MPERPVPIASIPQAGLVGSIILNSIRAFTIPLLLYLLGTEKESGPITSYSGAALVFSQIKERSFL
jgi:hypothetical protein